MCLVTVLRIAFKQALASGRIYKQLRQTHDPIPQPPSDGEDLPVDFNNYVRQLQHHEWTMFETHERQFRKSLDTKLLQERAYFACSGDPAKWSKVTSILTGVFFQNGIFRTGNINGKEFGLPLLKYATRILKKFPLSDKHPTELHRLPLLPGLRNS